MKELVTLELLPLGAQVQLARGAGLQDALFAHGVEFPCGGRGRCKGCRVRVIAGELPITAEDRQKLSAEELAAGWRLSCRAKAEGDLRLEVAQWETPILGDDSTFSFAPQAGSGIAIDIGTTTVVGQLVDLTTGRVLAVRSGLNAQAKHGADIMSRIEFAMAGEGQRVLEELIRGQVGRMCGELVMAAPGAGALRRVTLVGNTVMHHLFGGISVEPLSHVPFEPRHPGRLRFRTRDLRWDLPGDPEIYFLPCLGGFVGSDILAGVAATRLHERAGLTALLDLGTNGEIVVGNRERLLCASTAAGPAFEGARISMGMRAATGAVSEVRLEHGRLRCHVLGNGTARGICGSGLVDAVAVGLDLGKIRPNGRLADGDSWELTEGVLLSQWDIRELQLAKGAIAAGLELLLREWGAAPDQIQEVFLAGAFGNYIHRASARRIGLLNFPAEKIKPVGNTALLGAKLALFDAGLAADGAVMAKVQHLSLHENPRFQETYVEHMAFPAAKDSA